MVRKTGIDDQLFLIRLHILMSFILMIVVVKKVLLGIFLFFIYNTLYSYIIHRLVLRDYFHKYPYIFPDSSLTLCSVFSSGNECLAS